MNGWINGIIQLTCDYRSGTLTAEHLSLHLKPGFIPSLASVTTNLKWQWRESLLSLYKYSGILQQVN